MFSLSDSDLDLKILGCGDGPASFNSEMNRMGRDVISIDPIYQFTKNQLENRIDEIASSNEYYVTTSGSGTTCSSGSPCSIDYAFANAVAI